MLGGSDRNQLNLEILKCFVARSGGESCARLLILPTASEESPKTIEKYTNAFQLLNVQEINVLDIRTRRQADEAESVAQLDRATGVLLSGGDQLRLLSILGGTRFMACLIQRFEDGLNVAGSSAGAMAVGDPVIVRGEAKDFYRKESIVIQPGLNLYPGVVVDTHLVVRGRLGRLFQVVALYPDRLGIGIEEGSGVLIAPDGTMTAAGPGITMIVDGREIGYTNAAILGKGDPIAVEGFRMHLLAEGTEFHLPSRCFPGK